MREVLSRYLTCVGRRDVEGVLGLMAADVSVEDPVGGPPGTHVVGREAVGRFFRRGFAASQPAPRGVGPIRTTAQNQAAVPFVLELTLAGVRSEIDVIDVVTFGDDGLITELRAFWNLAEARPLRSGA
jgi:steroid delta-isomerase